MTATMKVTNLQNESSATPNIVLNADGTTTIAGTTATALTTSGNLTFTGTGGRITGDFSNATLANRVAFQSSTTNGSTGVYALPNGTSATSGFTAWNNSDITNASNISILALSTETRLQASVNGTGTYLPIAFHTGGSERLRLDTAGNLGLGVTPTSGWSASFKVMQISSQSAFWSSGAATFVSTNNYNDGGNKYIGTGNASRYYQSGGQHIWENAPSGTAGNAITFTQAMTLNASGQLSVGTTSAGATIRAAGSGTTQYTFPLYCTNASSIASFYVRDDGAIITGTSGSGLAACPYNNITANAANMVVGANGDLQRSTSSLRYKTDVQNATHGLTDVMNLRSVTYKGKNDGDKIFGGLIAEEVDEAGLTEFVVYDADGQPDALHYGNMVALAFKAIQEQQAIITQLQADVAALKGAA